MQIPALSKRNHHHMSPDATKRINMETVTVLMKGKCKTKELKCLIGVSFFC